MLEDVDLVLVDQKTTIKNSLYKNIM